MTWSHQHCCPICLSFHFHEHDEMMPCDVTFRHRLCLVDEKAKNITPEPNVRRIDIPWAG